MREAADYIKGQLEMIKERAGSDIRLVFFFYNLLCCEVMYIQCFCVIVGFTNCWSKFVGYLSLTVCSVC